MRRMIAQPATADSLLISSIEPSGCARPTPSAYVTGFGCRPSTHVSTGTEGRRSKAARERSRGTWSTRFSRRYGDLGSTVGAARACCGEARRCEPFANGQGARRGSIELVFGGGRGVWMTADWSNGHAPSVPAVDQRRRQAALADETGEVDLMTCRSSTRSTTHAADAAVSRLPRTSR